MIFYDFEVFKYDWLVVFIDVQQKEKRVIVNDPQQLREYYQNNKKRIFIGFNSRNYDQYIFKAILLDLNPYDMSKFIIEDGHKGWEYLQGMKHIPIINYDVMVGFHGLKQLEAFMGHSIKESDVPFDIARPLTDDEITETIGYCTNDVEETIDVFLQTKHEFESHISLVKEFGLSLTDINKTKSQMSAKILGAVAADPRNDEFNITIPDTLKIKKYAHIVDWYKNPINLSYENKLEIDVAGVPHVFAWGGLHGAVSNYYGEGIYMNMDVASLYPSLMIEYNYHSRNIKDPSKYVSIRDTRLKLKRKKDPRQLSYKLVLNSTYGSMKDAYNALFDPLMANNVCVAGQLLLLDLIEQLEGHCQLIQSNTDGLFIKLERMEDKETIMAICDEWQQRTRLELEFDMFTKIYQKDVNNYIVIHEDGSYKSKGTYLKKLSALDNDLPIVNKALVEYFINNTPVEKTIMESRKLMDFQKVVKVSGKYKYALHAGGKLNEKVLRVFASKDPGDSGVFKVKKNNRIEKIANTPERCFIVNGDVTERRIPRRLDRQYYIDMAYSRINDFIGA